MKAVWVIVLAAILDFAFCEDLYTSKYDNLDIDMILRSNRLLNNYVKCVLGTGNCTSDGNELKRVLPEALQTDCAKCSPRQRQASERVLRFLVKNKRSLFDQLVMKFDPEGVYRNKYRAEFAKEGITI